MGEDGDLTLTLATNPPATLVKAAHIKFHTGHWPQVSVGVCHRVCGFPGVASSTSSTPLWARQLSPRSGTTSSSGGTIAVLVWTGKTHGAWKNRLRSGRQRTGSSSDLFLGLAQPVILTDTEAVSRCSFQQGPHRNPGSQTHSYGSEKAQSRQRQKQ